MPGNTNPKLEGLCPFLGFSDDRDTALSYPSQYNCCYNAKPVVPVSMYHQRCFCLSKEFTSCPVYQSVEHASLPKEIIGKYPNRRRMRPWLALTGVIIIVLVVSVVSAMMGVINIPGIPALITGIPHTPTPTFWVMPSATNTIDQSTATLVQVASPTETEIPLVPTAILPHFLETPLGADPELVFHRVEEGEGFILLANTYNTSAEAIQAINYEMGNSLFANRVIVIPINTTDVSTLPAFTVFEVTEDNLFIETVAMGLNVDIVELCKYNHLPERYVLTKGEWLLIPR